MTTLHAPAINYLAILPFLFLTGAALFLLFLTALTKNRLSTKVSSTVAVSAALAGFVATFFQWFEINHHGAITTASHAIAMDGFSAVMTASICSSLVFALLIAHDWQGRERFNGAEYQMLALLATSGSVLMTQANDLVLVFLGLEILSIALYCLIAFNRRRLKSSESSMKYFLLGGFAAAIFIYGAALTYGATGTTNVLGISYFLAANHVLHPGLLFAGGGLMMVAFAFKVQAVPFHFWSPDVYEGAPTPVTGFHASIVWGGAYAAMMRVMIGGLGTQIDTWRPIFFGLIVLSCLVGAAFAILQGNAKRLLAYSSVSHSGFILLGVWTGTAAGLSASAFYVLTYAPVVLGSFAIVALVGGVGDANHELEKYRGLARRNPWIGASLAVLLLSQLGVPLTVGFVGKFSVLSATINAGDVYGAIVAIVSACIAAFAYLRWTTGLFADENLDTPPLVVPWASRVVITLSVIYAIVFGIDPGLLTSIASHASLIFQP